MFFKKIKSFIAIWLIILIANQVFIFGSCFSTHCIVAALPHTAIIAFFLWRYLDNQNIEPMSEVEDGLNKLEKWSKEQQKQANNYTKKLSLELEEELQKLNEELHQMKKQKAIKHSESFTHISTGNQYDLNNKKKDDIIKITPKNEKTTEEITSDIVSSVVKKAEYKNIIPYLDFRGIECFYHFTELKNLKSILQSGGLMSFQELKNKQIDIIHVSNKLSWELDAKKGLSDFIRLSFVQNHPMFWKAKYEKNAELIWIKVDREVATWENTKFTDKNATDKNVRIGNELNFLKTLDYVAIQNSRNGNKTLNEEQKKHIQSEVLVKRFIPKKYFINLSELERMI